MSVENPELGEIRKAREIGRKSTNRVIWYPCDDCKIPKWTELRNGIPIKTLCKSCTVKRMHGSLKGYFKNRHAKIYKGGFVSTRGYKLIYVKPDDFFASMRNNTGYVAEHRLVMAKSLGRCLSLKEIVHHKNHNKLDNRLENLQLVGNDEHSQITMLETRIKFLENRIRELEK